MEDRVWEAEELESGQTDFNLPLNGCYDLTISRTPDMRLFVWQISSLDEPTVMSADAFGEAGRFGRFADAFSSLVDYLWDNYAGGGRVSDEEISTIPYVPCPVASLIDSCALSVVKELSSMRPTSLAGIIRLLT